MWWNKLSFKALLPLVMWASVTSCQVEPKNEELDVACSGMVEVRLAVDGQEQVRSILPEESIETKISDVTLASYDSEGRLVNTIFHERTESKMALYISGTDICNVYVVANMGNMTSSFPDEESGLENMVYTLGSYDLVAARGIPMCGSLKGCTYEGGKVVTIPMERLFAKLRTRILHTGLTGSSSTSVSAYTLCNKSIYVRQANRLLRPFSQSGSAAEAVEDVMNKSDYNPDLADRDAYEGSLKPSGWGPGLGYFQDTTVVLYVPENVQGVLLPGNTDPLSKTADSISDIEGKSYGELCSYLEFTAEKPLKGDGYGGEITYRCYLGEDNVTDFSVRRNRCYDLTMNFTDDGFLLNNWKVVRGEGWTDTRTLCFVEGPYIIYPGTTTDVLVHYNRFSTSLETDSSGPLSDWTYEYDGAAMRTAGLTCSFLGATKIKGARGYSDHCFKVIASSDAKVGASFPIKVMMADGSGSDVATVQIAEVGKLAAAWDFKPEYVSQKGTLKLAGVVKSLLPFTATVSDPSVVSCVAESDDTFVLTALHKGTTDVTFRNSDGSQTLTVTLDIAAPRLQVSDIYIALAPDGEAGSLDYYYADNQGNPIMNVDEEAYMKYLKPVMSGCSYVSMDISRNSMGVYLGKLYDAGKQVNLGSYYDVTMKAADCAEAGIHDMRVYVINPFNGQTSHGLRRIDDYTLFTLGSVHSAVKSYFADEIEAWADIRYNIPPVDADQTYVTSSMAPEWQGTFSYGNGVYYSEYDHKDPRSSSGASVTIGRETVSSSTTHSAGRHDLKLHVRNRHSDETVSHTLARIDVYVHVAIGAVATFGTLKCSAPSGGAGMTVAGVYNSLAGQTCYSTTSSGLIHYMDVSIEYLTDISGVYVFSRMKSGVASSTNIMNCLDVVRPSVSDGKVDANQRMLYSVCVGGGQRVAICGEPYGQRKGIGTVLYRALYMSAYSSVQSEERLEELMLGYNRSNGLASGAYAPCYTMHDMNQSTNMSDNVVKKTVPYYFSPTSCSSYRDVSGQGYHVIHTLNEIAPEICGWVNLL